MSYCPLLVDIVTSPKPDGILKRIMTNFKIIVRVKSGKISMINVDGEVIVKDGETI